MQTYQPINKNFRLWTIAKDRFSIYRCECFLRDSCGDLGHKYQELMAMFLGNCYYAYGCECVQDVNIRYSANKNNNTKSQYNKFGHTMFMRTLNKLIELDYIDDNRIKPCVDKEGQRFQSSFSITNKLRRHFDNNLDWFCDEKKGECLFLHIKNDHEDYLDDYKDNPSTRRLRSNLVKLNNNNKQFGQPTVDTREVRSRPSLPYISHWMNNSMPGMKKSEFVNSRVNFCAKYHRVFNNDWKHGGRWYSQIQSLPKEIRSHLYIGNEQTAELDFTCLHPYVLYAREGIQFSGDAYLTSDPHQRLINKLIILAVFCSSSREQTRKAALKKFRKERIDCKNDQINATLDLLEEKHTPISKWFYSGCGLELQYTDSTITGKIVKEFVRQKKPIYPVHDSYIVRKSDSGLLRQCMINSYREVVGYMPEIK